MSDVPPPPPPGPQPPPPPPAPQQGPQKVGPWPRLGARIIDGIVLFIPTAIVNGVVGVNSFGGTFDADDIGAIFVAGIINALIALAYFAWMESNQGRTVGKMALNMHVVGPDGQHPTTEQAVRRNAFVAVQGIPVIGGLLALVLVIAIAVGISNDARGQGPHDRFAGGTLVYRAG